jgi:hypothetical protein
VANRKALPPQGNLATRLDTIINLIFTDEGLHYHPTISTCGMHFRLKDR